MNPKIKNQGNPKISKAEKEKLGNPRIEYPQIKKPQN